MRAELERIVRESGKPHRVIAASANCTETTLYRILRSGLGRAGWIRWKQSLAHWSTR
jgi:hypothetical protein